MTRQKGVMKPEDFKKLVDEIKSHVQRIYFNFAGEPFLNPNLCDMIKYAEDRNIATIVMTNSTMLHKYMDLIFNSGMSRIYVAMDGATKETQEKYRVGSDFEQVKSNILELCRRKKALGAKKPHIVLQFVVMKHNEHEIPRIIEFAKSAGVDQLDLKSVAIFGAGQLNKDFNELAESYLPANKYYSRYGVSRKRGIAEKSIVCPWIFQSVIFWNGDVTTCCYDNNGVHVLGNALDKGFKAVWNSIEYRSTRKKILNAEMPLCKDCELTRDYKKTIFFNTN